MSLYALATVAAISLFMPIHDMSDPNAAWYRGLTVPGELGAPMVGSSCCNGGNSRDADCKNVDTRERGGHIEAWIDTKTFPDVPNSTLYGGAPNDWVRVPEDVIIHGRNNPTGMPVACFFNHVIRCFVPGVQT